MGTVGGGHSGDHWPLFAVSVDMGLRLKSVSIPWVESKCHFPRVLCTQSNSVYLKWILASEEMPEDFPARPHMVRLTNTLWVGRQCDPQIHEVSCLESLSPLGHKDSSCDKQSRWSF